MDENLINATMEAMGVNKLVVSQRTTAKQLKILKRDIAAHGQELEKTRLLLCEVKNTLQKLKNEK